MAVGDRRGGDLPGRGRRRRLVLTARGQARQALVACGALALVGHGLIVAGVAPALRPLWLSNRAAKALAAAGASPAQGVIPGPVTVAGYEEPSLVFLLGAETELGDASDAAQAIAEGRPAIVEQRQTAAFQAALAAQKTDSTPAGRRQVARDSTIRTTSTTYCRSTGRWPPPPASWRKGKAAP